MPDQPGGPRWPAGHEDLRLYDAVHEKVRRAEARLMAALDTFDPTDEQWWAELEAAGQAYCAALGDQRLLFPPLAGQDE